MKFHLTKFNVGDRVIIANQKPEEARVGIGTAGVIVEIYTFTSCVRPGETLYKIAWQKASGDGEFYWNIADSALVLEKEWEKRTCKEREVR